MKSELVKQLRQCAEEIEKAESETAFLSLYGLMLYTQEMWSLCERKMIEAAKESAEKDFRGDKF